MELSSISEPMRTLSAEEFADLLAQADLPQAGFARLAGISPRQVNKWCRGHAAVRRCAGPRHAGAIGRGARDLAGRASGNVTSRWRALPPILGRTGG
jgi:DNA-binding transcriptional regulator YdaS (Cro superfamily)